MKGARVSGPLLVITATTVGKWWLSFETPAKNHSASCTAFAPAIHSVAKAKHTTVTQKCSARAARKTVLSSTPSSGTSTAMGPKCSKPGVGATSARMSAASSAA